MSCPDWIERLMKRTFLDDLLRPISDEEFEKAWAEAPAEMLSEQRIKEIVDYATGRTNQLPSGRVLE